MATLNKILPGWGESNDFVAPGSPRWRQSTGKVMQKTGRRAGLFAVRQAGRLRFSQGAAKQREQQREVKAFGANQPKAEANKSQRQQWANQASPALTPPTSAHSR